MKLNDSICGPSCCVFCDFFTGAIGIGADLFNEGLAPQVFTQMKCIGNETELLECERIPFTGINCPTSGVVCQGTDRELSLNLNALWLLLVGANEIATFSRYLMSRKLSRW